MENINDLNSFTDIFNDEIDEIDNSQPMSITSQSSTKQTDVPTPTFSRPARYTGQCGEYRSRDEIDSKYRNVFSYQYFNQVQSRVIDDTLYSDKSIVVCAPTGSGKTVVFEMAIVKLLMDLEDQNYKDDFKIIYMAPVKAICTERITEWYPKFTQLGCHCIEVTGDTDVDFSQLKSYRIIITTPEKWDMLTRRWTDHRQLVEVVKLFMIDEVHILNDETRGPVLEAVVSRMKTVEASAQTAHRIEILQRKRENNEDMSQMDTPPPRIRFIAVSATVSNPEDVAAWLGAGDRPATFHKFGDECRPVKIHRVVEGYPYQEGTSMFKFDLMLNYKIWPIIQRYQCGNPTLVFCNTRKGVMLTAETLSREVTITFNPDQQAKLAGLANTMKNKKLQALTMHGIGCHHAGLLFEERVNIENAFKNRDLPILITTTTLAMGVNLPAHLVIIKNTQQYVNGTYQEYSISTILQMVGRAGRPQFDTEATAVIMTRMQDKPRYQALVGGFDPLQSYLHRRLAENLNSEAALRTVTDVAQCVQWLRSTFLFIRAGKDPRRYLGLPLNAPSQQISKKIEELCVKAMNGLASSGLITMDDACCIESTAAGRLMSIYYLDFETMKLIMKINGNETLEKLLWIICESHELNEMHLRVDERRCLNSLNKNNTAGTIRFPMKGKITTRQMKVFCIIQAVLGCLPIPEPSLNQEAMKVLRIADRVCQCMLSYITRTELLTQQPKSYASVLNGIILSKCIAARLWENSPFLSRQLKGIGPAFSTLLASAGKNNFMNIEQSHPRDLERIMNKGPPAGNVLQKQISLLPKYDLKLTTVDDTRISVQVTLLNQTYLSENINQLTAGESHKCYIVVGDKDNCLLLLSSFKDKDLIKSFQGQITYIVKRNHDFEYQITIHCISSSIVGIDVQEKYTFKSLQELNSDTEINVIDTSLENAFVSAKHSSLKTIKKMKQTAITDMFQQRKRKTSPDINNAETKEKRKKANNIVESINNLRESFGIKPKEHTANPDIITTTLCNNSLSVNVKSNIGKMELQNIVQKRPADGDNEINVSQYDREFLNFGLPDTEHIVYDSILNNIENEIKTSLIEKSDTITETNNVNNIILNNNTNNEFSQIPRFQYDSNNYRSGKTKPTFNKRNSNKKLVKKPNNYNFFKLLEKNVMFSNEEEITAEQSNNGFTAAIKDKLDSFLETTKSYGINKNECIAALIEENEDDYSQYNSQNLKSRNVGQNFIDIDIENKIDADILKLNIESKSDSLIINLECEMLINETFINNDKHHSNDIVIISDPTPPVYLEADVEIGQICEGSIQPVTEKSKIISSECVSLKNNRERFDLPLTDLNLQNEIEDTDNKCQTYEGSVQPETEIIKTTPVECISSENNCDSVDLPFIDLSRQTGTHSLNEIRETITKNVQQENNHNENLLSLNLTNNSNNVTKKPQNITSNFNEDNSCVTVCDESNSVLRPIINNLPRLMNVTNINIHLNKSNMYVTDLVNNKQTTTISGRELTNAVQNDEKFNSDNKKLTEVSQNCVPILNTNMDPSVFENMQSINNDKIYDNHFYSQQNIQINDVQTSTGVTLSSLGSKILSDKSITKCQLEVVKTVKFDFDVIETTKSNQKFHMNTHAQISKDCTNSYDILPNLYCYNNNSLTNTTKPATKTHNFQFKDISNRNISSKVYSTSNITYDTNYHSNVNHYNNHSKFLSLPSLHCDKNKKSLKNTPDSPIATTTTNLYNYFNKDTYTNIPYTPNKSCEKEKHQNYKPYNIYLNDWNQTFEGISKDEINTSDQTPLQSLCPRQLQAENKPCEANITPIKPVANDEKILTVQDILNKYRKALEKIDIVSPTRNEHTQDNRTTEHCYIKQQSVKETNMFKIQNINQIDIDLPEEIIPNSQSQTMSSNVKLYIENKQKEFLQQKLKEIENTSEIELPESETHIENNHINDVDIDNSMLNPKTLLESFHNIEKSNEIIPPPMDFCDYPIYDNDISDTTQNIQTNIKLHSDFINNAHENPEKYSFFENMNDKNIFHHAVGPTIASVNMSMSHEVETWTLSPDYESDERVTSPNAAKSFTVMRTKHAINPRRLRFNRNAKLNNFKYRPKHAFKYKKQC